MADASSDLATAAQLVADAELAALKDILAKAQAFVTDMTAIAAGLPFPAGFTSKARQLSLGMASNLSFIISNELPNAINALEPQPPAAPTPTV